MTQGPLAARVYAGGALNASYAALIAYVLSPSVVWLAPLRAATLFLGYRAYLRRIDDERRYAQQMVELHMATIEALALAIDAKDYRRLVPNPS